MALEPLVARGYGALASAPAYTVETLSPIILFVPDDGGMAVVAWRGAPAPASAWGFSKCREQLAEVAEAMRAHWPEVAEVTAWDEWIDWAAGRASD